MPKKPTKVLIIEDDPFLLNIYSTKFEGEGYEVILAENGELGLKLASQKPDIILLDIMMPKLDGFGVLEGIKKKKELSKIPIILLTNLSQSTDVDKGLAMGANDYLIKAHFMPSEVVSKVEKILGKKKDGSKQKNKEDYSMDIKV